MRLFGFELTWATAAFGAVLPEKTSLPHGIARMQPARYLSDMIAAAPLVEAAGLRLALWIVALSPLWLLRRPRTIGRLGAAERQLVLERLLASPVYVVRQLAFTFKALASMLYAQSPEARSAMTTSSGRAESELPVETPSKREGKISHRPKRNLSLYPAVYSHDPAE